LSRVYFFKRLHTGSCQHRTAPRGQAQAAFTISDNNRAFACIVEIVYSQTLLIRDEQYNRSSSNFDRSVWGVDYGVMIRCKQKCSFVQGLMRQILRGSCARTVTGVKMAKHFIDHSISTERCRSVGACYVIVDNSGFKIAGRTGADRIYQSCICKCAVACIS
jgi:hypothetical protein